MPSALGIAASEEERNAHYRSVRSSIDALLDGENDWIAAMATVACELHHAFGYYDWTGFYRVTSPGLLVVGPYQGGHGCLRIPFARGVCGAAARTATTQVVPDVHAVADHIACSAATRSEIVVPVVGPQGVIAVLDVDSNAPGAFGRPDAEALESVCAKLALQFANQC